ncbi:MAG TPA: alpha/beta hydrolase-fold protein [Segetibacter sp.]
MIKKILTLTNVLYCLLFSEAVSGQNSRKELSTTKPFVLGVIDEIQSAVLSEKRILNIYLPEGYNKNDTTKYPVVYLLDGSADEDFIHVVGLYQFNSFPWI